jgi:alpha-N-arabinofuranosidase
MTYFARLFGALALAALLAGRAGAADSIEATLTVHTDRPQAVIAPEIYGQFAEHLGHGIYGGLWVGPESKIPNTRGFRNDVVGALKALGVPVVRWPGGCFADQYHWRDGIGPRGRRPVRVNTTWGGVEETNAVGIHEYMDLMGLLGSKSYIDSNVGTGSPQETKDWLEYMASPSHSELADLRRKNGRAEPWRLDYWAFGNELWGCGGTMRPEYYADLYHRFATFAKTPDGNTPKWIAAGGYGDDTAYTEALMASDVKAHQIDAITLHHFALPLGNFDGPKGPATGFGEDQWMSVVSRALALEGMIAKHEAVMDRYDPQKRVALYVDEWSNWYDVEPGTNPGFLSQQNTLRDALTAAATLDIFHAHADRVRMACITQMVNVLQAMIHTDGAKMFLTPTYHVYMMYRPFRGATALAADLTTPDYAFGADRVPAIRASAARTADGRIVLALVNLDPRRAAHVAAAVPGVRSAAGSILTAAAMDAHNDFAAPNAVHPVSFDGATLAGDRLDVALPAKSVVVLELR